MRTCAAWLGLVAIVLCMACSKSGGKSIEVTVEKSTQKLPANNSGNPPLPAPANSPAGGAAANSAVDEEKNDKARATAERIRREEAAKAAASALDLVDIAELERKALAGDKDAQTDLGIIYYEGRRVQKDLQKAAQLWAAAARQGHPVAQENLRLLQLKDDEQEVDDSIAFFGTKSKGRRFVFIIDKSGSMMGRRFEDAKSELVKTLRALPPRAFFMIYFFNSDSEGMPVNNMLAATPKNIEWAVAWVNSRRPFGGTDPSRSLSQSFSIRPDTIWLLSDGQFADGQMVIHQIRNSNRNRSTRVNTLAFHDPIGEAVLKQIASGNDGTYRFVKP